VGPRSVAAGSEELLHQMSFKRVSDELVSVLSLILMNWVLLMNS
jgi:hypothetical protein